MKDSKAHEKKDVESKNKKSDASHELSSEANALKDALKSSKDNGQNTDQIDLKAVNPNVLRELLLASARTESIKLAKDVEKNGYSEKDRDLILECLIDGANSEKSWNGKIQTGESKEFDSKDGFVITEKSGNLGGSAGAATGDGFLKLDQKDGKDPRTALPPEASKPVSEGGSSANQGDGLKPAIHTNPSDGSKDPGPTNPAFKPAELSTNPNPTNPNLTNPKLEPPNPVAKDPVNPDKPLVTPKPGGSNNSEQDWRDAELTRIKRQQEIDALEKANHSSSPPSIAPVVIRPANPDGVINKDGAGPSKEPLIHKATDPILPGTHKITDTVSPDTKIKTTDPVSPGSPGSPAKPEKTGGGRNSNDSEQAWRDAELTRIKHQKEIDAWERANHSSSPPRPDSSKPAITPIIKQPAVDGQTRPKPEQPKPEQAKPETKDTKQSKTDATPKADGGNKPDAGNKPTDSSKPRNTDTNSGGTNKSETRPRTDTPRVENTTTTGRKDSPAPVQDSKKGSDTPKASETVKNVDRALDNVKAQTMARSSVNEGEAIRLQKAQQDAAKMKDASAEKNAAIDPNKLDAGKKSALNMSLISSATADLHGKELNAQKANFVIPYATLARQSLLEAGKAESLLKSRENAGAGKDGTHARDLSRAKEDGRQAFPIPVLKGAEKAGAGAATVTAGKYFDSSSRASGGERFRSSVKDLDAVRPIALPGSKSASAGGGGIQDGRAITRSQIGQIATPGRVVVGPGSQNVRGDVRTTGGDARGAGELSISAGRSNRPPSTSIHTDQIGGRTTGVNGRTIDAIAAARFINIAGRNELVGPNIVGARTFRIQDGRQMPGVELVMGALLTSAAIAKARRGNYDAELAENPGKDTGRSTSWIEALIAEKINKKYKDKQEKDANQKDSKLKDKDKDQSSEQNKDTKKDSENSIEIEQQNLEVEEEEDDDLIIALDVFNQQLKEDFEEYKRTGLHRDSERIAVQTKSSNVIREKYTIESGDTLERLAESRYHNKSVAWLIADINTGKTKESVVDNERVIELYVGQLIELPGAEEAEKFLQEQSKKATRRETNPIGRLVTIVSNLGADSDIMEDILGKIV